VVARTQRPREAARAAQSRVSVTPIRDFPAHGSAEFKNDARKFDVGLGLVEETRDYDDVPEAQGLVRDRSGRENGQAGSDRDAQEPRDAPPRHPLDWAKLATKEPPPRSWVLPHWLGYDPTLVAGAGAIGKTLLLQMIGTALSMQRRYIEDAIRPCRVLMWAGEDQHDELWRRQVDICRYFGLEMADLKGKFIIEPRHGLDNTLLDLPFGKPTFTPLLLELRQQVNDYQADALVLDNIAQVYGGVDERHQVTMFVNGVAGLVRHRPFAPIFLGHVARTAGSEFSGSAAWENACRMRWYLGSTLPDQKPDDDQPNDDDTRYLARRKANYSPRDWVRLTYRDGVLIPDQAEPRRFDTGHRHELAEAVVLKGLGKLRDAGVLATDGPNSPDYLPRQILAKGFAEDHSKKELAAAMNQLMGAGRLRRDVVGKYSNRTPRFGLVEVAP
jgi:RecA-family ATPase